MADRKKIKKPSLRTVVQAVWTALTNGYAYGFINGKIYTGRTKSLCVPGLNCYSCPGALGSCPIGALQATLGSPSHKFAFYTFGMLMLFGSIFGRFICGWLCPFGLVQDLLHKIPVFRKIKKLPGHKILRWLKYIVLAVFVLLLPAVIADEAGIGMPWFCEYICPSGMLSGGIPLVAANEELRSAVGIRFIWKLSLLLLIIIGSVKIYRPFCKYLCPLGAFYSLFNRISLYRYRSLKEKCTDCGACEKVCLMGIKPDMTPNSLECIRCGKCIKICPHNAIEKVDLLTAFRKENLIDKNN